jgi:ribonuclease P protein subunit POP4
LEEIIGKEVRVARSSCKDLAGTQGRILDETKNTLLLQTEKGRKRIPKSCCDFFFVEEGVEVPGKTFAVRPEDRTKKLFRK